MKGTVDAMLAVGYTQEQATLIGALDDLFEKAIELKMLSPRDATIIGSYVSNIMGKFTGKL